MDTLLQRLEGKDLFSKFDIRWGYNNIPIQEGDRWKAAFKTPLGTFQPNVLYFGMKNTPAIFTRLMFRDFKSWLDKWFSKKKTTGGCYMDDFFIASEDSEEGKEGHRECMHDLLDLMMKHKYYLRPAKCIWQQSSMDLLGLKVHQGGRLSIDPAKMDGIRKWPRDLTSRKDVQKTMGVLQYQRAFVPHFSTLARPIFATLKKGTLFVWTSEAREALDKIINIITTDPSLPQPDLNKPFELEIDASAYATGGVLIQRTEDGAKQAVAYTSTALNAHERNYDVYDREYLSLIRAMKEWRHLLEGHPHCIKVWTDHANLTKHREGQKLNGRIARAMQFLSRFDYEFHHLPGNTNMVADALSRRPDHVPPEGEEQTVVTLPDHLFVKAAEVATVESDIRRSQRGGEGRKTLQEWANKHGIEKRGNHYWRGTGLVVVNHEAMAPILLKIYHNGLTAGHPGVVKTFRDLQRNYWWPDMRKYVQEYVKGCAICQSHKILTHRNNPDLDPITPKENAKPFETISIDLIVKLPESERCDAILTITDHDCTKAVVLIPCRETMNMEELAGEYKRYAFPYIGIPSKIISDRDTRFTSKFTQEMCQQLDIKQNISTAYHPQTNGQSEKTNQHIETTLRIFCNYRQNDWAGHLPIVQYMLNTQVSETTKFAPFELWMGHVPRSHQPSRPSGLPRLAWHEARFEEIRKQAQSSMLRAQALYPKMRKHVRYNKGDKVWLESKNLKTTHPTTKLRALRYGPFEITEVIRSTTYRLKLPPQWKIHNAFHASLLTPYKATKEHGENFPQQLPEIVEGEEEWTVEKVLDSRRVGQKRRLQYLLKWEGYPEADNSWEYKEDIFSPDLIAEFHRKHPTAIKGVVIRSMSTAPTSTPTDIPPTAQSSSLSLTSSCLEQYDTIARAGAHNWRDSSSSISVDVYNTWPLDPPAGRYTPYPDSPSPAKHPPTPSHARDPTSTTPSSSAQIDSLAGQLQQLRISELPADAPPRQEEVPLSPGSPPPQPTRPRGEDIDKGKGRELPEVAALPLPQGMTEQELQEAQERRSEGG